MGARLQAGVTLIELMVTVAVVAVLGTLAAPSLQRMVENERLRSITSELATDLQLARAEASARGEMVRLVLRSDATMTCYTVFTAATSSLANRCNCLLGPGNACTSPTSREVKTVQVMKNRNVTFGIPVGQPGGAAFAFDHLTGGIAQIPTDADSTAIDQFRIFTTIEPSRRLWTTVNRAGRVTVCAPAGTTIGGSPC